MIVEITPQVSINTDNIESIEIIDDLNCVIYTNNRSFVISMPKNVVVEIIESRSLQKTKPDESMLRVERLLNKLFSTQQSPRI